MSYIEPFAFFLRNLCTYSFVKYISTHTYLTLTKGHLISKANCQAVNSSKKRTNEFVFTTMRRVFVHFLEEIEVNKKHFEIN